MLSLKGLKGHSKKASTDIRATELYKRRDSVNRKSRVAGKLYKLDKTQFP